MSDWQTDTAMFYMQNAWNQVNPKILVIYNFCERQIYAGLYRLKTFKNMCRGHLSAFMTWSINWSSEGRSFVMRSLNPCSENLAQNLVDYTNLLRGRGVIYYAKSEVLELESKSLFLGVGGNLLHATGR